MGARLSSAGYKHNERASSIDCSSNPQTQDGDQAVPMPSVSESGPSDLAHISPLLLPLLSRPPSPLPSPPPSPPAANPPSCLLSSPQSVSKLPACSPAQFAKSSIANASVVCDQTWSSISRLLYILSLPCPAMNESLAVYLQDVSCISHGPSFRQLVISLG